MVDFDDAETHAAAMLREARLDGDDTPNPRLVAKRVDVRLIRSPKHFMLGGGLGQRGMLDGRHVVRVRAGLSEHVERFVVAHELGHVAARRWNLRLDDEEGWCNAFAGALMLPRRSVRSAWTKLGDLAEFVVHWPHVPPTCAALRLGEIRAADVYVVQGRQVIYARAEEVSGGDILRAASEALDIGSTERAGLRAARLPEVARRAAVMRQAA